MAKPHPASRAEDALNSVVARGLGRRGWGRRVMPYTGYAGPSFARVLARIVMSKDGQDAQEPAVEADGGRRGFRAFFSAPLTKVEVTVTFGDATVSTITDRGGYIDVNLVGHGLEPGWREATITAGDVQAQAPVQVISPDAEFGIISDIDDTCLVTSLPRPVHAAWNTFVLEETARKVVPGMPAMYRSLLARNPEAPVIYLSTGAWNTQPVLDRFLRRHGFPPGPLLLTDWGPTETAAFRSGQEHKHGSLRRLAMEFPHIKWLLVGDDGQHDPRIYEEFALEQPESVDGIAIRKLTVAQRVLSHGHPLTKDDVRGRPVRVMVFEGSDGFALHRLIQNARRQRESAEAAQQRSADA
ncbi:App1 family protein [Leekyejoonella antrihumi]|uniref:DUF2183 domain-containing protein n=1 Tax=Leekyejoonella antrihumi TaxID=1660198 RepID=A0A563E5S0_9MICO|nr:phosphatase domain-containing protein [Leekyejoonella antrihumi]TWP37866.1 DUF2183 domain-containing protein [Leekyejoonella antrihumi]